MARKYTNIPTHQTESQITPSTMDWPESLPIPPNSPYELEHSQTIAAVDDVPADILSQQPLPYSATISPSLDISPNDRDALPEYPPVESSEPKSSSEQPRSRGFPFGWGFTRSLNNDRPSPTPLKRAETRPSTIPPLHAMVDRAKSEQPLASSSAHRDLPKNPNDEPRVSLGGLVKEFRYNPIYLTDLVAPDSLREQLMQSLRENERREELRRHNLQASNRIFLMGPAGTGKRRTAVVLATELKLPLYRGRISQIVGETGKSTNSSSYVGGRHLRLRYLTDFIRRNRAVYLFEDHHELTPEDFMFLEQLIEATRRVENDALLIITNSKVSKMNRALLRKFDLVLNYPLPNCEQSVRILQAKLTTMDTSPVDWSIAAEAAKELCHADIALAAERAAKKSLLENRQDISTEQLLASLSEQHLLYKKLGS